MSQINLKCDRIDIGPSLHKVFINLCHEHTANRTNAPLTQIIGRKTF